MAGHSCALPEAVAFPINHTGPESNSSVPTPHTCLLHEYKSREGIKGSSENRRKMCLCKEKMRPEAIILHLFSPLNSE